MESVAVAFFQSLLKPHQGFFALLEAFYFGPLFYFHWTRHVQCKFRKATGTTGS